MVTIRQIRKLICLISFLKLLAPMLLCHLFTDSLFFGMMQFYNQ